MTLSRLAHIGIRVVWVVYALVLFLATHLPVPEDFEEIVSLLDKVLHASAYFVLGILTFLALNRGTQLRPPGVGILLGLLAYAALDEFLQGFVDRSPDLTDWMSDAAGIAVSFLLLRFLLREPQVADEQGAETESR